MRRKRKRKKNSVGLGAPLALQHQTLPQTDAPASTPSMHLFFYNSSCPPPSPPDDHHTATQRPTHWEIGGGGLFSTCVIPPSCGLFSVPPPPPPTLVWLKHCTGNTVCKVLSKNLLLSLLYYYNSYYYYYTCICHLYNSEFLMPVVFRVGGFCLFFSIFLRKHVFPHINSGCFLLWLLSGKWYLAVFVICLLYVRYDTSPKLTVDMFLSFWFVFFCGGGGVLLEAVPDECHVKVESESLYERVCVTSPDDNGSVQGEEPVCVWAVGRGVSSR